MLTRMLRSPESPLFWKDSGACCLWPCVGSWVGHVSGSVNSGRVVPHGFTRNPYHGQAGTRRWHKKDKSRCLCGFNFSGPAIWGPYIPECNEMSNEAALQSVVWFTEQPAEELCWKSAGGRLDRAGVPLSNPGGATVEDNLVPWKGGGAPPIDGVLRLLPQPNPAHKVKNGLEPLWGDHSNFKVAAGEQLKRLRRRQLNIWGRRTFTTDPKLFHCSVEGQVAKDYRAVPHNIGEEPNPGGLSFCTAYLEPYSRPFDMAFRKSMQTGRFKELPNDPLLMDALRDSMLWDASMVIPSEAAAADLAVVDGKGTFGVKKLKTAKAKSAGLVQEYFFVTLAKPRGCVLFSHTIFS